MVPPALQAGCFKKCVMYSLQTGCTYRFIYRDSSNTSGSIRRSARPPVKQLSIESNPIAKPKVAEEEVAETTFPGSSRLVVDFQSFKQSTTSLINPIEIFISMNPPCLTEIEGKQFQF